MNINKSAVLLRSTNAFTINYRLSLPMLNMSKKESAAVSMLGGALKKKKLGKLGPVMEKKVLPVETDPHKLINYVCGSNIYKTGEDIKLKPDSEYPDWLWGMRTGPVPPLEELDPESKEYWLRIRKMAILRNTQLRKLKRF